MKSSDGNYKMLWKTQYLVDMPILISNNQGQGNWQRQHGLASNEGSVVTPFL